MIAQNSPTKTLQLLLTAALAGLMIALGVGLISLPPLLPGPAAHAAGTIDVTTPNDEYDTSGSGSGCSLREAIESINTVSSFGGCTNPGNAADTIQLQAMTYTLSIPFPTSPPFNDSNAVGDMEPKQSITIRGAGSGQTIITTTTAFNDGIFSIVSPNANIIILIEGMTVQGGKSRNGGGGIYVLLTSSISMVTLTDLIIENNRAVGGGGIDHEIGILNLNDVTIRNNQATGAVFYDSDGGGLSVGNGNVTLNNVLLYGNQAVNGGAIFISEYYYIGGEFTSNNLQLTNVTLYDNQAAISGGGLYLNFTGSMYSAPITVTATNATIANNRALSGSGGNIYNNASTISLKNTLIANGLANGSLNNCDGNPLPNITSLGHNLDSGNTCALTATGDLTNTNPLLAASLADNGGSTETLALLPASPAIDAGTCSGAPPTDQRGVARPQGVTCDIGAYEAINQPHLVLTKSVGDATPNPGQRITYTIAVQNSGLLSATNAAISDTLPAGLSLAGPVTLKPAGSVFTPTLPTLVSGLTITAGKSITLTVPVTVSIALPGGTTITNTAAVTSLEVVTPQTNSVGITVAAIPEHLYLPVILKN